MIWNSHYKDVPKGAHAFLGASQHSWLNYDEEKLITVYKNRLAVVRGTKLHDLAKNMIEMGVRPRRTKQTFNMYVDDCISGGFTPEQVLYFSPNSFGTADAIRFKERQGLLTIHDLKTGVTPASLHQLEVYAALFCLEYGPILNFKPSDIQIELAIYQNNDILCGLPEAKDIVPIMDKIIRFDEIINSIEEDS